MGRKRSGRKVAPDLTEKFFASIQSAARQEDATTGANVRTGRINGAFKTNSRADIQRDYASTPDNMEYAVIAGGNKPKADDPVLFIDGEGGPVIIGRPWRPGERDLEQVDRVNVISNRSTPKSPKSNRISTTSRAVSLPARPRMTKTLGSATKTGKAR